MIMSEKIMSLRKKMGWSQEELANELNVSRQSVSKWETGVSIPDMAKIVMMSEVFGVTTDYLLKEGANDEILELNSSSQEITSSDIKKDYKKEGKTFVTIEEADAYLDLEKKNSLEVGFGVALCIWSSIILIILESISESKPNVLRESLASAIGVSIMFIMIAIAVYIFFTRASRAEKFSYIEKEVLELAYGVEASIKRKKEAYAHIGDMNIALGVVAIILGVIPVVVASSMDLEETYMGASVSLMLFMIGIGVMTIIKASSIKSSFKKILEDEESRVYRKLVKKEIGWLPGVFFSTVTAIYLGYSFITEDWSRSWIIWPVASVGFAALYGYVERKVKHKLEYEK